MACYQKQLILHKLPLPMDTLHIVYDYCFDLVIDVQRKKKALMLNVLKKQIDIETNIVKNRAIERRRHGHENAFTTIKCFFVYPKYVPKMCWGLYSISNPELHVASNICSVCGDFINPKTKYQNRSSEMRKPWKISARPMFSNVICKANNGDFC
uniref:Uncharacterized protein n=1 Tax=viral metagenome TaxID=1070528 RepID=A0A6C0B994_9ZZZZ